MGKRRPATTRSTYIVADEGGGTRMPSWEHSSAAASSMHAVTMPGDTRQSSNYAVQGSTLMQWDDYEGGSWNPVRTLGPQDIYQAPAPAPGPGAPAPAPPPADDDDDDDREIQQSPAAWQSYASPAETQAMTEAEDARTTRAALLKQIEDRRKLRLKNPRKFGRFSLMSGSETGVPSLLGG